MPTLTIRDVPEAVHARLAARAAAHGLSPDAEALRVLEHALTEPPPSSRALSDLARLRDATTFRAPEGEIESLLRERRDQP